MSDQILDEDEVLRNRNSTGPSFWSDFRYFVWALVFGIGMIHVLANLFYFIRKLVTTNAFLPQNTLDIAFKTDAIHQTLFAYPLTFLFVVTLVWLANRTTKGQVILKYIYAIFGALMVFILFLQKIVLHAPLINGSGFLLGAILVGSSIFMLSRKGV